MRWNSRRETVMSKRRAEVKIRRRQIMMLCKLMSQKKMVMRMITIWKYK